MALIFPSTGCSNGTYLAGVQAKLDQSLVAGKIRKTQREIIVVTCDNILPLGFPAASDKPTINQLLTTFHSTNHLHPFTTISQPPINHPFLRIMAVTCTVSVPWQVDLAC